MSMDAQTWWMALSVGFALIAGFNAWKCIERWQLSRRHKESLKEVALQGQQNSTSLSCGAKQKHTSKVITFLIRLSTKNYRAQKSLFTRINMPPSKWFERNIRYTGLEGRISARAFTEAKCRIALGSAIVGCVIGLMFSYQMAFVCALVGAILGWQVPQRALQSRIDRRVHESERHLPEMLDVIALGMRSGLSFDSSLKLYAEHFDTELSCELALAQRQWSSGLARRDEALRQLAHTYKSTVLGRVVETIVRSIRYGSSMVQSLEEDAMDARGAYRSERQERIAKAPVKMMIPTGVLILPAMLIMVLGPVLLELAGGGL